MVCIWEMPTHILLFMSITTFKKEREHLCITYPKTRLRTLFCVCYYSALTSSILWHGWEIIVKFFDFCFWGFSIVIFRIPRYLSCVCRDILYTQPKSVMFVLQKTFCIFQCFVYKFFYVKFVTSLDILVAGFLSRLEKRSDRSVQKWPNFML